MIAASGPSKVIEPDPAGSPSIVASTTRRLPAARLLA